MKQAQLVLGIDPGTSATGYGLVEKRDNQLVPIDYGCIRPGRDMSLSEKYLVIYNGLCTLMDTYQPSAVSVETQFVQKNAQSALKLGMARGMVILAAAQRGIPLHEYAPTRAKQAVVGNGRASKAQVQAMVQVLLKLKELPKPEDAADALALAICHMHAAGSPVAMGIQL